MRTPPDEAPPSAQALQVKRGGAALSTEAFAGDAVGSWLEKLGACAMSYGRNWWPGSSTSR